MSAMIPFTFRGDTLDVVRTQSGDVAVPLRQLCEVIGVDADTQAKKLRVAPWATTVIITVVAADGKNREVLCLSRRSIPMWAASINANKVAPEIRAKLIAYQLECADVLADHFLGKRGAPEQTALAAAHVFAQQSGLVGDDVLLAHRMRRAIRRAVQATNRTWASVEAMIRRSTGAQGWTRIAAFNADKAIALLEAVEDGIVDVPIRAPRRAKLADERQTLIPFQH